MSTIEPIVIDFETDEILPRPSYPPRPVGFSILNPGEKKSTYYAWGHPTKNNCDEKNAKRVLLKAWTSGEPLLFHNSKFDYDVAEAMMGMPKLPWERIHDTMFLAFLDNPHALELGLKPLASEILGMSPKEQQKVRQWLIDAGITRANDTRWGRFISKAPGDIVGEYANGDVVRTARLFRKLYPAIVKRGMLGAYNRERRLMPILLENERTGFRIDLKLLNSDIKLYQSALDSVDVWLRKRLKQPELNLDSDRELADVLDKLGIVEDWTLTKTGKKSTSKKFMTVDKFKDAKVASALGYRNRLMTCLSTFMLPWKEMAEASKEGTINTTWNQTRQSKGEKGRKGTRTGRPSTNDPNFLNIPKSFYEKNDGYTHPSHIPDTPELPLVRRYCLPDKGAKWLHRDYNQQELRILAHFENGAILEAYRQNPDLDIHTFVQSEIKRIAHLDVHRTPVKTINFGRVYGQGLSSLSEKMDLPIAEVKKIRDAQNKALPGLKNLDKSIKEWAMQGKPIVTWGGREYYVEPPKMIDGKMRDFYYKLLNYLVQGSAADCTKEAIIRYHSEKKDGRFLVTVYDEINICAPNKAIKSEMNILKSCMESIEFDLLMKSDGKIGPRWGELIKYKE